MCGAVSRVRRFAGSESLPRTLGRRWQRAARWVQRAEPYVRLLGLLHFLAFLVYGRYRSLWDRLFGLRLGRGDRPPQALSQPASRCLVLPNHS